MKSNHYTKLMINWDWFFCDGSSEFSLLHRFHTDYKMTKTALKCVLPDCDYETDKMADEGKLVDTLDTCSGWQPQFHKCRTSTQSLLHAYCIAGGNAAVAESGTPLTTACDVHIAQLGTACMVLVLYDRSDAATARYCTAVTIPGRSVKNSQPQWRYDRGKLAVPFELSLAGDYLPKTVTRYDGRFFVLHAAW